MHVCTYLSGFLARTSLCRIPFPSFLYCQLLQVYKISDVRRPTNDSTGDISTWRDAAENFPPRLGKIMRRRNKTKKRVGAARFDLGCFSRFKFQHELYCNYIPMECSTTSVCIICSGVSKGKTVGNYCILLPVLLHPLGSRSRWLISALRRVILLVCLGNLA